MRAERTSRTRRATHLVRRFFGMLVPVGPRRSDQSWALGLLKPGEQRLWSRMGRADRRHAAGVARRVEAQLDAGDPLVADPDERRAVLAAALLHDVGKIESRLGTYGRVVATLSAATVRHDPEVIRAWRRTTGFTRRVGLYLEHPRLGGDLLAMADSDPLTEAWAREHHLAEDDWTLPVPVAQVLKDADDD